MWVSPYESSTHMTITIKSKIPNETNNIKSAIKMVEESLMKFLKDMNADKRLLYDLNETVKEWYQF